MPRSPTPGRPTGEGTIAPSYIAASCEASNAARAVQFA